MSKLRALFATLMMLSLVLIASSAAAKLRWGADAEGGTAARDVVKGCDGLGEQRGMPVGIAGDERREANGLGVLRERGQDGVALEHRLVRCPDSGQLVEVIHHENSVEPRLLRCFRLVNHIAKDVCVVDAGVGEVRDLIAESGQSDAPALDVVAKT